MFFRYVMDGSFSFLRWRVADTFWFADTYILSWCFDACDYQHVYNKKCFMCDIFASPGLRVLEGDDCRAPLRCAASDAVAERKQNQSNDVVPLFYNRCEH